MVTRQREDFEHWYSFGWFDYRVVKVFFVSEFRIESDICACIVVLMQIESTCILL